MPKHVRQLTDNIDERMSYNFDANEKSVMLPLSWNSKRHIDSMQGSPIRKW